MGTPRLTVILFFQTKYRNICILVTRQFHRSARCFSVMILPNWQPFEWNTSCVNSILQMLKSIPEIAEMISSQTYKLSNHTGAITEICDEIYNIFQAEGVVDTVDRGLFLDTTPPILKCSTQTIRILKLSSSENS